MEVVKLSGVGGTHDGDDLDRRREVLGYALANLGDYRPKVGIYGYEVCQVCGDIGRFSGLYGAMSSHRKYPEPTARGKSKLRLRFVAGRHHHQASPEDHDDRFREVCRRPGRPEEMLTLGHHLLCGRCQEAFGRHASREHWSKMLSYFVRERPRYHALIEAKARGSADLLPHYL